MAQFPAELTTRIEFRDANHNDFLDSEETDTLLAVIANRGRGKTSGLTLTVTCFPNLLEITIVTPRLSDLSPGDSLRIPILLRAHRKLPDKIPIEVTTQAHDKVGNVADFPSISLETRSFKPPELVIAEKGVDDDREGDSYGDNDHCVEPKETIELALRLQNLGLGEARKVHAKLRADNPDIKIYNDSTRELGALKPGETRLLTYLLSIFPRYAGSDTLPLYLQVSEVHPENSRSLPLNLVLNREEQSKETVVVKGRDSEVTFPFAQVGGLVPSVEIDLPETRQSNENAWAVVIGNRQYKYCESVDFAERDAEWMERYFQKTFGVPKGNVIKRIDATRTEFERIFGSAGGAEKSELRKKIIDQESDVYIYYSGHGFPDFAQNRNEAYFVPSDGDVQDIGLTGYAVQTLYNNLALIPAKSYTIIIDACFCGESPTGPLMKQVSKVRLKVKNPVLQLENKAAVFSACGPDQVANWYQDQKHGFFTWYFMKGLQGAAADLNRNGIITAGEMKAWLEDPASGVGRQSRIICGNEQNPQVFGNLEQVLFRP
jgi:hypothetical protein